MSAISWAFAVSGDWNSAPHWSGGVVPGAGDDVTIDASGSPYDVTLSTADAARSLTLDSTAAMTRLVSGGTLSLGGTLDVAAGKFELAGGTLDGGTLTATGGTFGWSTGILDGVTFDGTLDLSHAGSHLAIGSNGIVVQGAGGTGNGVIDVTGAGSTMVFEGTQTLDNATLNIGNGAYVETNTTDFDGKGVLTLGANATINQVGLGVLIAARGNTIVNDGVINAAYTSGHFYFGKSYFSRYPALFNFTNHGVVHVGARDTMTMDTFTVINDGSIVVDSGGVFADTFGYVRGETESFSNAGTIIVGHNSKFYFSGDVFSNSGTITAEAGSTVSLQGNLQNSGVITATQANVTFDGRIINANTRIRQSIVNLYGSFSTAQLGILGGVGNAITLVNAQLDNSRNTLTVGAGSAFGTLTLINGASISGGTISDAGSGIVFTDGALAGVTYEGALNLAAAASRLIITAKGLILTGAGGSGPGALNVTGDNCTIAFAKGHNTLDNAIVSLAGAHAVLDQTIANAKPGELTLGANLIVNEVGAYAALTGGVGINQGALNAVASGGTFAVTLQYFVNQGVIDAGDGGTFDIAPASFQNFSGTTLSGGTFEADAGSTISLNVTNDHNAIVADGAIIVLDGAGSALQSLSSSGVAQALDSTLATIASGGVLELLAGRGWSSTLAMTSIGILQLGGGVFAPASLVNKGIVTGYGALATTVTDTGAISVQAGQTLSLVGGTLTNLAGGVLTGGTYSVAAGATLQLANDTAIAALDAVLVLNSLGSTVQGLDTATSRQVGLKDSLNAIDAAGVLELLAGRNFTSGQAIANMGVLQLGGGTFSGGALTDAAGATLKGFGTVASTFLDSGAVSSVGGALGFSGSGDTFAGGLGGTEIDFTGGTDLLASGASLGSTALSVSGAAVVTLGASFAFAGVLTQAAGTTLALKANTLTLGGVGTTIAGTVGGGGTLAFTGGTQTVASGAMLSVAHWSIGGGATTIAETLGYKGAFTLGAGAALTLTAGDKFNLTGAATLSGLVNGASRLTVSNAGVGGLTLGGTVTLDDAGSVTQTGAVTVGDASSSGATVTIDAGAAWTLSGGGIARGASSQSAINVKGTLTDRASGTTTVAVKIVDTGAVVASAGLLNLTGALSGTGALTIGAGAGLEVTNVAAAGLTVGFQGGDGLLALASPARFAATIAGFDATDTLDLVAITATSATLGASDTLVIRNGTRTVATLQLSGDYAGDTFTATSDGAGGTNVTLAGGGAKNPPAAVIPVPRAAPVLSFVTAMAGVAHSGGLHAALAEPVFRTGPGLFAAPRIQAA